MNGADVLRKEAVVGLARQGAGSVPGKSAPGEALRWEGLGETEDRWEASEAGVWGGAGATLGAWISPWGRGP